MSVQKYKIFHEASAAMLLEGFWGQGEFSIRCSTDWATWPYGTSQQKPWRSGII